MSKESKTPFSSETVAVLEKSLFVHQTVKEAMATIDEVFFDALASENSEDTNFRNRAIVTYKLLRKTLACLQSHQHPDDDLVLQITVDL